MPTPAMTDALALEAYEASIKFGSISEASRQIGVPRNTLASRVYEAKRRGLDGSAGGPPIPDAAKPPPGFIVHRNSGQFDGAGNLERQWVGTTRDAGEVYEPPERHLIKGESTLVDADGRVLQRWVKTKEGSSRDLVSALQDAFAAYAGSAPAIPAPSLATDDLVTLYPLPDLHLGMYSWAKETGADYDVQIATEVASRSIAALVHQSQPSSHAVLIALGDMYHQNDSKNATPTSNHLLDVDGRWPRVYLAGANLMINLVEQIARKHRTVEVVVLEGNHDKDAAATLAVALSLYYSREERIKVHINPSVAWYRRFGKCLIGAHHGHTIRTPERMAMAMAVDCASDWGITEHRLMLCGHLHHEIVKECGGVRVEYLNSPAARDAWNSAAGHRAGRALSAITIHKDEGEIGRHKVNISGSRPKIRVPAIGVRQLD